MDIGKVTQDIMREVEGLFAITADPDDVRVATEGVRRVLSAVLEPEPVPQQDDAAVRREAVEYWKTLHLNSALIPIGEINGILAIARRDMVPASELESAKIDWGVLAAENVSLQNKLAERYTLGEVEKAMRNVNQTGWVVDENDRVKRVLARLTHAPEPTKQERVTVTRMGASEHVFVEFDGKIIYQFDDHEDEENDAEFHAKRYAAGLRQELEETK